MMWQSLRRCEYAHSMGYRLFPTRPRWRDHVQFIYDDAMYQQGYSQICCRSSLLFVHLTGLLCNDLLYSSHSSPAEHGAHEHCGGSYARLTAGLLRVDMRVIALRQYRDFAREVVYTILLGYAYICTVRP